MKRYPAAYSAYTCWDLLPPRPLNAELNGGIPERAM